MFKYLSCFICFIAGIIVILLFQFIFKKPVNIPVQPVTTNWQIQKVYYTNNLKPDEIIEFVYLETKLTNERFIGWQSNDIVGVTFQQDYIFSNGNSTTLSYSEKYKIKFPEQKKNLITIGIDTGTNYSFIYQRHLINILDTDIYAGPGIRKDFNDIKWSLNLTILR